MDVAAAYSAGRDADKDLAGARTGSRQLCDGQMFIFGEQQGLHVRLQVTAESPWLRPGAWWAGSPKNLRAEGRPAAAGALHVRVLELEAGRFKGFHVVDHTAVQVHQRGRVHENLHV